MSVGASRFCELGACGLGSCLYDNRIRLVVSADVHGITDELGGPRVSLVVKGWFGI